MSTRVKPAWIGAFVVLGVSLALYGVVRFGQAVSLEAHHRVRVVLSAVGQRTPGREPRSSSAAS